VVSRSKGITKCLRRLEDQPTIPWIVTFDYRTVWAMAMGSPHPETMVVQLKYGMMTKEFVKLFNCIIGVFWQVLGNLPH
jgi:hypothetical protein